MNARIPFDPQYVQSIGKAVYFFAYYEWIIIYVIEQFSPGFVNEYSRDRKMTSGHVAKRLKKVLLEGSTMAAEIRSALDTCCDEFVSLIPRRNALIHAHPITDTPTGEQILNFQGRVSEAIADMKWTSDKVERFAMDVSEASTIASSLFELVQSRTRQC